MDANSTSPDIDTALDEILAVVYPQIVEETEPIFLSQPSTVILEWGGEGLQNQIINPEISSSTVASVIGEPQPVSRPKRDREQDTTCDIPHKTYRDATDRMCTKNVTVVGSRYLRLYSGKELFFTEADGHDIILSERQEPDRLIRNIISRIILYRVTDRLLFLHDFNYKESDKDSKEERTFYAGLMIAVYSAYIKECKLRYVFRRFLNLWRKAKMDRAAMEADQDIDPITLSTPEKGVVVYDWVLKKRFVFDARSLANLIESKLMYQEYGFPCPLYPKNPWNNIEFTYKHMVSIYYQIRAHGEATWSLITLRRHNFNKSKWHAYNESTLIMNAIKSSIIALDSYDARELLCDFIFAKMHDLGFNTSIHLVTAYKTAMIKDPKNWYLEKLKAVAIIYYESHHFGYNRDDLINTRCAYIFDKQPDFIADLKRKKYI